MQNSRDEASHEAGQNRSPFAGPGEMRALCRGRDWVTTPLGPVDGWPISLRTTAMTVLAGGFPSIVLWGPQLVQLYNDGYTPFLGVKHPSAIGMPTHECWPELRPVTAPIYEAVYRGETVTQHDQHYPLHRRGADVAPDDVYITNSFVPVRDESGAVGGVLVTLFDTSAQVAGRAAQAEQVRLEAGLRRAREATAILLDQVSDAYLLMDHDFRITAVNQSAERATGRPREDLVGRTHWDAFPGSVGAEPERQYRRAVTERVEAHFITHYVGDGYDVHVEIDAYPTGDNGLAVFWRDISERVRALGAVEAARADAEARAATLAAVIESMPDAVLVGGPDAITFANRAALEQLGVPSVEALQAAASAAGPARPLPDVLLDQATGAVVPLATTPVGRALRGEQSHAHFLLRALGAPDSAGTRPVRVAAAPIVGAGGAILGAVAVLTDRSRLAEAAAERERLLQQLAVERDRISYAFQQAPAFLAIMRGPTHVFELVNAAYEQLVGGRELVGKSVREALPEMRDQRFIELLDMVLATGEPFVGREVPVSLARTFGAPPEQRFVDFVYLPLVEADGTRSGIIAHGSDVTEQVQARREIERLLAESEGARLDAQAARAEAEAANRAKGEFLAVMSHELRTPLNAIGGYAELMEMGIRGPVTPQQRDDLRRVQVSQRHLLGLINEVLNYAKLETGTVHYDLAPVRARGALGGAEVLIAPQAQKKGLTLVIEVGPPDLLVRADADKLQQILVNLLSNAVKFTDRGGRIALECTTAGKGIRITVCDTGSGIAADQLERIFEPFVQVRADFTRPYEGTGLGLAISRELARGMAGDLTVESTLGVGSVFTLELPWA
ncbi:MAG: PAS domain-containing protein [bacterium]